MPRSGLFQLPDSNECLVERKTSKCREQKQCARICPESVDRARIFTSISCLKNKFSIWSSMAVKQGSETATVCSKAEARIISKKERTKLKLKLYFYLSVAPVECICHGLLQLLLQVKRLTAEVSFTYVLNQEIAHYFR